MNEKILIIDDEKDIRVLVKELLEDEGYAPLMAANSDEAYQIIARDNPALIIQDIWLQGSKHDGLEILKTIRKDRPDIPFIMISGHGTIETAVFAIKQGAYDFIEKPFKSDRLLLMVHRALERANLKRENILLKQQTVARVNDMVMQLPKNIRHILGKASDTNSRVFLIGEVGTGKNIAAHYLHENSNRKNKPFLILNCTNRTADEIELELFGSIHKNDLKQPLVGLVDGGTLLLDDVLSLPIQTQGKILMMMQENAYCPIGSNQKVPVDIRIIASSNTSPQKHIDSGAFRQDLYYRLNVVSVAMPTLRERRVEIDEIIKSYCDLKFTDGALAKLRQYNWPGNLKQLNNVLEWHMIMYEPTRVIDVPDLPPEFGGGQSHKKQGGALGYDSMPLLVEDILNLGLRDARERFERFYLLSQVNKFNGNISKTAEFIGMERSALHRKLKTLDVFADEKQNVS